MFFCQQHTLSITTILACVCGWLARITDHCSWIWLFGLFVGGQLVSLTTVLGYNYLASLWVPSLYH